MLDLLEAEHGFGPRHAYPLLQDLGARWSLHCPLLDCNGNWGSRLGDPAADARYTELRLSPVGALARAAERAEVGPVPLGLIEGSLYRGGRVPPFAPGQVLDALMTGGDDAGPPAMPTGGTISGDIDGLLAGEMARLSLSCTIVAEPGRLVISELPLGVPATAVVRNLQTRLTRYRRPTTERLSRDPLAQPLSDVRDESSSRAGIRIVCIPANPTHVAATIDRIRDVWPVTIDLDCQLPAPMSERLTRWDRGDASGLSARVLPAAVHRRSAFGRFRPTASSAGTSKPCWSPSPFPARRTTTQRHECSWQGPDPVSRRQFDQSGQVAAGSRAAGHTRWRSAD